MTMTHPDGDTYKDAVSIPVRWGALFALAMLLIGVTGCVPLAYYWRTIDVETETHPTTNQGMPVAVEIVFVHDTALVDTLGGLSATEWFHRKQTLTWKHPEALRWHRWEWAPGQRVPSHALPVRYGADAAYVFASYQSSGPHRTRIPPYRSLHLVLNRDAFRVRPVN